MTATITKFSEAVLLEANTRVDMKTQKYNCCDKCGTVFFKSSTVCPNCLSARDTNQVVSVKTAMDYMDKLRSLIMLNDLKQTTPAFDYALAS